MIKTIVIALILLMVAFLLLGVKVLFVKGGRFPSGHVHDNAALRARGIGCASSGEDDMTTSRRRRKLNE